MRQNRRNYTLPWQNLSTDVLPAHVLILGSKMLNPNFAPEDPQRQATVRNQVDMEALVSVYISGTEWDFWWSAFSPRTPSSLEKSTLVLEEASQTEGLWSLSFLKLTANSLVKLSLTVWDLRHCQVLRPVFFLTHSILKIVILAIIHLTIQYNAKYVLCLRHFDIMNAC